MVLRKFVLSPYQVNLPIVHDIADTPAVQVEDEFMIWKALKNKKLSAESKKRIIDRANTLQQSKRRQRKNMNTLIVEQVVETPTTATITPPAVSNETHRDVTVEPQVSLQRPEDVDLTGTDVDESIMVPPSPIDVQRNQREALSEDEDGVDVPLNVPKVRMTHYKMADINRLSTIANTWAHMVPKVSAHRARSFLNVLVDTKPFDIVESGGIIYRNKLIVPGPAVPKLIKNLFNKNPAQSVTMDKASLALLNSIRDSTGSSRLENFITNPYHKSYLTGVPVSRSIASHVAQASTSQQWRQQLEEM